MPTLTRPLPALSSAVSPSQPAQERAAQGPGAQEPGAQPETAGRSIAALAPATRAAAEAAGAPNASSSAPGNVPGNTPVRAAPAASAPQAALTRPAEPQAATTPSAAPQAADREGRVEWGDDNVVITFATNSSYFPPGTTRQLAALLKDLEAGKPYRVRVEVGVSGSDTVVGATSPEEARQYNRWLAERRMGRVQEWLDQNLGERSLDVEPVFQTGDNSRRAVVRVAPVG